MSQQGLAQNDQKCQFRAKFGGFLGKNPNFFTGESKIFGTHLTEPPGPKMTKTAHFGPNWAFIGPKILIPAGGTKVLVPTQRKYSQGTLFALFFGWASDQMGQKCPYLAENAVSRSLPVTAQPWTTWTTRTTCTTQATWPPGPPGLPGSTGSPGTL